jgi:multiple sugar transport system permease protein
MGMSTQINNKIDKSSKIKYIRDAFNDNLPYWFMIPVVTTLIIFTIFPFIYNIYLTFVEYDLTDPASRGEFVGVENLIAAFSNPTLWTAVGVTVIFVVLALICETALGFLLAILVNSVERFEDVYRIIILLPMAVAPVSLATIGRVMLNPEIGVIPWLVSTITPISNISFLGPELALITAILLDVWQWTPFMFIIFYAGLSSVPRKLIEAAKADGAPTWRIYWSIIIPYMKPVLLVGILIRMIDLFRSFGTIQALTGGGPGNATRVFSIHLYKTAFSFLDLGAAGSMSVVYMTVIVVISNVYIIGFKFKGVW